MSLTGWVKSPATPSIALSLAAAGLLVYHFFCDPTKKFDGWAVALLVIVFLPWLGSIFETIEFPGGGKVEWGKKVEAKQERQATEIESLQFLLAGFLHDDEREVLQQLADGEPLEMSKHDTAKLNEQLRSLGAAQDPSVTLKIYADLFESDLDAVAVNLDAKIAVSVQSVSKQPVDRRRKRAIKAV